MNRDNLFYLLAVRTPVASTVLALAFIFGAGWVLGSVRVPHYQTYTIPATDLAVHQGTPVLKISLNEIGGATPESGEVLVRLRSIGPIYLAQLKPVDVLTAELSLPPNGQIGTIDNTIQLTLEVGDETLFERIVTRGR